MEQIIFIIIYLNIIIQLVIGLSNNQSHTIFGKYSKELKIQKLNLDDTLLINYYKSLHWKKVTHIIQGCLLGLILFNPNIFNIYNTDIQCNTNTLSILNIPFLLILLVTLWQLNIIPLYIPIFLIIYIIKIFGIFCSNEQINLIKILLACGYIIYNLCKRTMYPQYFIESSY